MEMRLTYLTDDPHEQAICHDYWQHDGKRFLIPVKEITQKHNVEYVGLAKRIAQWCHAYLPDETCQSATKSPLRLEGVSNRL